MQVEFGALSDVARVTKGKADLIIYGVSGDKKQKVEKEGKITNIGNIISNDEEMYVNENVLQRVYAFTSKDLKSVEKIAFQTLKEGNFPKNEKEVLAYSRSGKHKVSDKIKYKGEEYTISGVLEKTFISMDLLGKGQEKIDEKIDKKALALPVIETEIYMQKDIKMDEKTEYVYFANFNNKSIDVNKQVEELGKELGLTRGKFDLNSMALEVEEANLGHDTTNTITSLKVLRIILIVLVAVSAIIIIYSGFNVSIVEKKKQYGILKSIGATKLQINLMVLYEAIIFAVIGLRSRYFNWNSRK